MAKQSTLNDQIRKFTLKPQQSTATPSKSAAISNKLGMVQLRERKQVSYNETWMAFEASTNEPVKNTDQGTLVKFARKGIKNTDRSKALALASAKHDSHRAGKRSSRKLGQARCTQGFMLCSG